MVDDDRPRYAHWFRCRTCAHRFSVVRLTADSTKVKTPKCPHKGCNGRVRESHMEDRGMDVAAGRAPATTSVQAQAYDLAHKWSMQEQGATDIRDNARPGESSVAPLPPKLQRDVENFWGGPRKPKTRTARVDLSPVFGQRAAEAQSASPMMGANFTADRGIGIAPILTAKPEGTSPIPEHRVVGSYNPGRR